MFLDTSMGFICSTVSPEGIKSGSILLGAKAYQTMLVAKNIASKCFKVYALYSMYESALSDIFCLKTFRHGTNPYAAARIILTGPDLRRAGVDGEARFYRMAHGAESPWAARDRQRQAFYVVGEGHLYGNIFLDYISTKLTAKYYALRSTAVLFGSLLPLPRSWKGNFTRLVVEIIESDIRTRLLGLFCPTVKFHINPNRIDADLTFHQDEGAGAGALYTYDRFSVLDIGILGVLKNGINTDLPTRMWENKRQVLWGVAQLVVAVAFTAFYFPPLIPGSQLVVSSITSIIALREIGVVGELVRLVALGSPLFYAGLQV